MAEVNDLDFRHKVFIFTQMEEKLKWGKWARKERKRKGFPFPVHLVLNWVIAIVQEYSNKAIFQCLQIPGTPGTVEDFLFY